MLGLLLLMILLFIPQILALGKTLRGHCLLLLGPLSTLSPRSKLAPGSQGPSTGSDKQSRYTVCSRMFQSATRAVVEHAASWEPQGRKGRRKGPSCILVQLSLGFCKCTGHSHQHAEAQKCSLEPFLPLPVYWGVCTHMHTCTHALPRVGHTS